MKKALESGDIEAFERAAACKLQSTWRIKLAQRKRGEMLAKKAEAEAKKAEAEAKAAYARKLAAEESRRMTLHPALGEILEGEQRELNLQRHRLRHGLGLHGRAWGNGDNAEAAREVTELRRMLDDTRRQLQIARAGGHAGGGDPMEDGGMLGAFALTKDQLSKVSE